MGTVYTEVTNTWGTTQYVGGFATDERLAECIAETLADGHAVTAGSHTGSPDPIVGCHAYIVRSVQEIEGVWHATVYNVWGRDGASWDGAPYDGLVTISLELFRDCFSALSVSAA